MPVSLNYTLEDYQVFFFEDPLKGSWFFELFQEEFFKSHPVFARGLETLFSNSTQGYVCSFSTHTACLDGLEPIIDSRNTKRNTLFFALKGARVDGHNFLREAYEGGTRVFVVALDKKASIHKLAKTHTDALFFLVEDPLKALQRLAFFHRIRSYKTKIFAVTGSAGKTTLKELLSPVLKEVYSHSYAIEGNLNSVIGLPLALLGLKHKHTAAVFELGIDTPGEMALLCTILKPDIALLTNIGTAHIEFFGSQEAIAKEKKDLLLSIPSSSWVFLPQETPFLALLKEGVEATCVEFASWQLDKLCLPYSIWLEIDNFQLPRMSFAWGQDAPSKNMVQIPFFGQTFVQHLACLQAVFRTFSFDPPVFERALNQVTWPPFRMQLLQQGSFFVLNDAYNASYESVLTFLVELRRFKNPLILVLGAMYELGEYSKEWHIGLKKYLQDLKSLKILILLGDEFKTLFIELNKENLTAAKELVYHQSLEQTVDYIDHLDKRGHLLALKGAHFTHVWEIPWQLN